MLESGGAGSAFKVEGGAAGATGTSTGNIVGIEISGASAPGLKGLLVPDSRLSGFEVLKLRTGIETGFNAVRDNGVGVEMVASGFDFGINDEPTILGRSPDDSPTVR